MTLATPSGLAARTTFFAVPPARRHATAIRIVLVSMVALAAIFVPNFASHANLAAIFYAGAPVGVTAVGLALITLSGNLFALSLSATAALSSIVFASLLSHGFPIAACLALVVGAAVGWAQGLVVVVFRSNPIIASIAAASLIGAAGQSLSGGRTVLADGHIGWLGSGSLVPGLPYQALVFALFAVVLHVVMEKARIGREIRLTGMNKAAAMLAGIRAPKAAILCYVVAGSAAAMAGIMIAAQSGAGNMRVGQDLDFSAIAAVLIGGIGIKGGQGRIVDAAIGAIFVAVLSNILLVNGFSYEVQLMIKGLAVLGSVVLGAALGKEKS